MEQLVNWYYDLTEPHKHSSDTEGNLVQLCKDCAHPLLIANEVEFASRGDEETVCEQCDMTNTAADEYGPEEDEVVLE